MATKRKVNTKKDLEDKIAALEAKLSNTDITTYIYKFYNIYLKFVKLIDLKDVITIFSKIEEDDDFPEIFE